MNLGGSEVLVIIVVALLVLGPDKLRPALRALGRIMGEVRKYQDLARNEIDKAMRYEPDKSPSSAEDPFPVSGKKTGRDPIQTLKEESGPIAPIIDEDPS